MASERGTEAEGLNMKCTEIEWPGTHLSESPQATEKLNIEWHLFREAKIQEKYLEGQHKTEHDAADKPF